MKHIIKTIAKFENLKDLIVELRGQSVLLGNDVAEIYGVETNHINQAVQTALAIIETFTKIRQLSRSIQ